ncbi:hypothetical protein E2C01_006237 [Portunus trituberculatus]|uniref:Uncharacterized protein n=1 Tax=Portunus trituberculatus TaxID=210409 RepID=A0A5B7CVR6_PORTR|nr:hypothetical protein [Portunus trituberculatus]
MTKASSHNQSLPAPSHPFPSLWHLLDPSTHPSARYAVTKRVLAHMDAAAVYSRHQHNASQ